MATRSRGRGGVRIPVRLDKSEAARDTKELADDIKRSIRPVVDVLDGARFAFDLVGTAITRLRNATSEVISIAAEQERVERRLTSAIQLRTRISRDDLDLLKASNAARQQLTGIGDEVQLQLQGTAALLGVEAQHLDVVTRATFGLAEITGQGLNEALRTVAKVYKGNTAALQEYGIKVASADVALDLLSDKFSVVEANSGTFAVQVDRLRSNFGDLLEELGNAVVKNEDVKKLLDDLSSATLEFIHELQENGPEARAVISEMVSDLRSLGSWISEHRDDIKLLAGLFVAARLAGAAGGIAGSLKNLGLGGVLGAAGRGAAGLAGRALPGVGAAFGGAGTAGTIATAGAGGLTAALLSVLLVPRTDRQTYAQGILEGILGERIDPTNTTRSTPRFRNTAFAGQGGDVDVEFGLGSEITSSSQDRERARDAARREEERKEREIERALARLKREAERRAAVQEGLRADELSATRAFNEQQGQLEVERLRAQRAEVEERNRTLFYGYSSKRELEAAELAATRSFTSELIGIGISGASGFVQALGAEFASGQPQLERITKGLLGTVLSSVGQSFIALGSAALAAASSTSAIPILWPIFGGPIGTAGAIGLISAGIGLQGFGAFASALGSSGGRAAAAARAPAARVPSFGVGSDARFRSPTLGNEGGVVQVINVNIDGSRGFMVGTDVELGRVIARLLKGNASFATVGG